MGKAIEGAVMLAGAVGMGALAFFDPALLASPLFDKIWAGLIIGGISMEAGAIAGALTSNRGTNITVRQAAGYRQIIYGEQRVGGNLIYPSTTGGHHDQYNRIIVIAGHECDSIVNLYLDGRQVFWNQGSYGNTTRNGVNFGGDADHNSHIGPNGQKYNFGTLVYCEARFGDQVAGDVITSATANDPLWSASPGGSPYMGGCCYVYLKIEYDEAMFPGEPEIKFTVRGKNNILDPRTGTVGYSNNWALIVADVLTDTEFGLGDVGSVHQDQLIAAANVCDEQVALALGGTESRYTCNWHYDTSTTPGDALQEMMKGAAGRLGRIGGEWYIWPAYYQGPSLAFDESDVTGAITWEPVRSLRDRFNVVTGTYIAPNYPYNTVGNLYDSNGWYDGTIANNFPYAFQPTNYPQYAVDVTHGYASNQYLTEDGGIILPREISQQTILSVAQAQRVAKIMLMRNRQQGSGSFKMHLTAYRAQPCDVITMTFAQLGWASKILEVTSVTLSIDEVDGVPALQAEFGFQETDPSVYEWSTSEELSVYDVQQGVTAAPYTPESPTNVEVISSAATAVTGPDGIMRPRAEITWDTPMDKLVSQIQVQYQLVGGVWVDAAPVSSDNTVAYVNNLIAGMTYNFQIRSLRTTGAVSPWVGVGPATMSASTTSITSSALNSNSPYNIDNNATVDSISENGSATIRIYGPGGVTSSWKRYVGSAVSTMNAAEITGNAFSTTYYVVYNTLLSIYVALLNADDALNDAFVPVGGVETCASTFTGTGTGGGGTGGGGAHPGGGRTFLTNSN